MEIKDIPMDINTQPQTTDTSPEPEQTLDTASNSPSTVPFNDDDQIRQDLGGEPTGNDTPPASDENQDPENNQDPEFNDDKDIENDLNENEQDPEQPQEVPVPDEFKEEVQTVQDIAKHLPAEQQAVFKQFNDTIKSKFSEFDGYYKQVEQYVAEVKPTITALQNIRQDFPEYQRATNEQIVESAYDLAKLQHDLRTDPINTFLGIMVEQTYLYQKQNGMQLDPHAALGYLKQMFDPQNENSLRLQESHIAQAVARVNNRSNEMRNRQIRFDQTRQMQFTQELNSFQQDPAYGRVFSYIQQADGGANQFNKAYQWINQNNPNMSTTEKLRLTTERVLLDNGMDRSAINALLGKVPAPRKNNPPKTGNKPPAKKNPPKKVNRTQDFNDDDQIMQDLQG